MANGDDQQIDISDAIRKRNLLLGSLPTITMQGQQQPTIPGQMPTVAPDIGYDPQTLKSNQQRLQQLITKDVPMDDYNKALQTYTHPPVKPLPTEKVTDPATGKLVDKYPRNKFLTGLGAVMDFKQIMRDPQKGLENLNILGRRGYGAAEQAYERTLAENERNYKAQSAAINQGYNILKDQASLANMGVNSQIGLGQYDAQMQLLPLQQRELALRVNAAQMEADEKNAPHPDYSKMWSVTPEGSKEPVNAYLRGLPGGKHDFIEVGSNKVIDKASSVSQVNTANMSIPEQLWDMWKNEFRKQVGHDPSEEDGLIAWKDIQEVQATAGLEKQAAAYQHAMEMGQKRIEEAKTRDARQKVAGDFDVGIKATTKRIQDLTQVKRDVDAALNSKDRSKLAAALAPLEEVRKEIGTARLNMGEYKLIKNAEGMIPAIMAAFDNWIGTGAPIPESLLRDLDKLTSLSLDDEQKVLNLQNKYRGMNAKANTIDDSNAAWDNYSGELIKIQRGQDMPPTPEEKQKKLQQIPLGDLFRLRDQTPGKQ